MDPSAPLLQSRNPTTGELLASFERLTPPQVDAKLALSARAYAQYRRTSFAERAAILRRVADLLDAEKERLGELMAREMGKLRQSGIEEAQKSAKGCRYYAEHAERILADQPLPDGPGRDRAYLAAQPLGPVLAIMPWNFPFWQVFRFAAPALMAGNTALLKHASNVPQCALAIEEVFRRAGLPEGVFQTLLIGSDAVEAVIQDPRVVAVTLTGSDEAGAKVAAIAGRALKKCVLELGGSDPFIVMPSVDLAHTVRMAVSARLINNGESCIAAKRFIVHERIADEFTRRFAEALDALRIGDPLDPETQVGPLATREIRDRLADQVEASIRAGARKLAGHGQLPARGSFFAPCALTGITRGSPAASEEFFGPVALVFRAGTLAEALEIANDSPFGLGASFWSADRSEQEMFAREIESGAAFVNAQVASDPALPFGGIKRSGYGRELGELGIREFVNLKTVVLNGAHGRAGTSGTE
jgi:succinate-semialdehyde dehydrogenase/glutarate-semialdehyde dehydrogenase